MRPLIRWLIRPNIRPWTLFALALVPMAALVAGSLSLWVIEEERISEATSESEAVAKALLLHNLVGAMSSSEGYLVAHELGYLEAEDLRTKISRHRQTSQQVRTLLEDTVQKQRDPMPSDDVAVLSRAVQNLDALIEAVENQNAAGFRGFTLRNVMARSLDEVNQMWARVDVSFEETEASRKMQQVVRLHDYTMALSEERGAILHSLVDDRMSLLARPSTSDAMAQRSAAFKAIVSIELDPFANESAYAGTDAADPMKAWSDLVHVGGAGNGANWFAEYDRVIAIPHTLIGSLLTDLQEAEASKIQDYRSQQRTTAGIAAGVLALAVALSLVARAEVRDRLRVEQAHAEAITDLRIRAERDALTGLWNRTRAEELIQKCLSERVENAPVVLAYVDLDEFKPINDIWGHPVGDEVLVAVAKRLLSAAPDGFEVVRFGGDEFVLFGRLENATVPSVADLGRLIVDEISRPMTLGDQRRQVEATVGLAFATGEHTKASGLLVEADSALILAKQRQRGSALVYDRQLRRDATLLRSLPDALENGEIVAHYQPSFDMETGRCTGVEALARWVRPDGEMVSPGEFIPLAESFGLISRLTDSVLRDAVSLQHEPDMPSDIRVWLNLSAVELDTRHFAERFVQLAEEYGADLSRLGVEITETAAIRNPRNLSDALNVLRRHKIQVAIDDFGNGYSPLGFLRHIPVDVLKLDRSLISEIDTKDDLQILVRGIVGMMRARGVEVVAEGIERHEEFAWLRSIGVEVAQGFLLARPLPKSELFDVVRHPSPMIVTL